MIEKNVFWVYRPCGCSLPERLLVVWGTENGSSLTFAGTQNSNMSDGGAKEQQQGGFFGFCLNHSLKPLQTKFKPSQTHITPQTPKLFPNLIVIPNIFCNFAHGITIQ